MVTKAGIYVNEDGRDRMMLDNSTVFELMPQDKSKSNRYNGLSTSGTKLLLGNVVLVNDGVKPVLKEDSNVLSFGDVAINASGTCVNITAEDYSKLMSGDIPSGYCRHRDGTIYNIVSNVAGAPTITYTIANNIITFSTGKTTTELETVLYNNVPTVLSHNTEDLTETVTSTRCPFVNTRYFNPIVNKNAAFDIEYHVDNIDNDWTNHNAIGDTFTVEVADISGNILSQRTTYGGVYKITIPAYSTTGEKVFTIRCIDSNGVASPYEFLRVLVKDSSTKTIVDMENYLDGEGNITFEYPSGTTRTIVLKNESEITKQEAYQNKAALTNFFAMAAASGANYVKMYNGGDTHYFIDYHTESGLSATCAYYKCTMNSTSSTKTKTITAVEQVDFNEVKSVKESSRLAPVIMRTTAPSVGNSLTADSSTDYAQGVWYCTINSLGTRPAGGDEILLPDNITIDLNGSTLQAIQSDDIVSGFVLEFRNNFNTHVINGKVYGNYDGFDFLSTSIKCGNTKPAEWLGVTHVVSSRFCSLENVDTGWSVGYDGCVSPGLSNFGAPTLIDNKRIDLSTGQPVDDNDMIITDFKSCEGKEYIGLGRIGYCGYQCAGTQREIFFSFYDSEKNYIRSYKSRLYLHVKVPTNAAYVRVTGYGNVYNANGDTSMSAWSVDWRGSSENGSLAFWNVTICDQCSRVNCYCHDTRTTAQTGAGYCFLVDNCTYERIGKEVGHPTGWDAVTPLLGDIEDNFQWQRNFTMRNCSRIGTGGRNDLTVHYCTVFNFIGNTGITLTNHGGIEGGVISDNNMPKLTIERTLKSLHPHVIYSNNVINTLVVSYTDYTATGEHVDKDIYMTNSTIVNENGYSYLSMSNSINGGVVYQ